MQSLSWVPLPTPPPRTKCSRSSTVLVFNLVFSPPDLYYGGQKLIIDKYADLDYG